MSHKNIPEIIESFIEKSNKVFESLQDCSLNEIKKLHKQMDGFVELYYQNLDLLKKRGELAKFDLGKMLQYQDKVVFLKKIKLRLKRLIENLNIHFREYV